MRTKMEFFKRILILPFLCIIILSGCSDDVVKPVETDVIMPLKVGNLWIYKYYSLDANGTRKEDGGDIITVTGTKVINGELLYQVLADTLDLFYANRPDGLHAHNMDIIYTGNDGTDSSVFRLGLSIKYPVQLNEIFYSPELTPDDSTHSDRIKVISKNKSVSVPAGTFSCYAYQNLDKSNSDFDVIDYFAPNIGFIKSEKKSKTNSPAGSYVELVNYTLK